MQKIITFIMHALPALLICNSTIAQNTFPSTGRVGVYTTSPAATLQVKGGTRIGTPANYVNIDSATGNLSFKGTAVYQVANNQYAFQNSANPGIGLYFNATNARYEFRNSASSPTFYVGASTGNGVFIGNLKVGAYTLPATDGTNGQLLKTNGTGTLTWSNDNTSGGGSGWLLTGNAGTSSATNFIGTTDAQPLVFKVNNIRAAFLDNSGNGNTSFGYQGFIANTSGFGNTVMGSNSLKTNTTGSRNTAIGYYALVTSNADNNTAIGTYALNANTSGTENVATGVNSLSSNTTGINNSAYGTNALFSNTTGEQNTANGYGALFTNQTGNNNAAFGKYALYNNTANDNTGLGYNSMFFNTTGTNNTATGSVALQNNTTGQQNTATGYAALYSNNKGSYNTAIGSAALNNNNADSNTANGAYALYTNTTGYNNTATGFKALYLNTTGNWNTASGVDALASNTIGVSNTANGVFALRSNSTGSYNTANGAFALTANTTGGYNTANGNESLKYNTTGSYNTANGYNALSVNSTGSYNTANGLYSLELNTSGIGNSAIGVLALSKNSTGNYNTANGYQAGQTQTGNQSCTFLGYGADASLGNRINATAIGFAAIVDADNKVSIGNTNVNSIGGYAGWTTFPSDQRFKKEVKEDVKGLDFILGLRPVSYTLDLHGLNKSLQMPDSISNKFDYSKEKVRYTGFIAQEVEAAAKKMNCEFSGVDKPTTKDGLYGLRYGDFVVPLVKAVQELSKINDDKDAKINAQDAKIAQLQKQMDDLKAIVLSSNANNSSSSQNITNTVLTVASLEQNIPNPFSHTTTIAYNLPQKFTNAQIIITDNTGKTLKAVNVSGIGKGSVNVDAATLSSGAYNYSLIVDGKLIGTKQMILAK